MKESDLLLIVSMVESHFGKDAAKFILSAGKYKIKRNVVIPAHKSYVSCMKIYNDFIVKKGFNPKIIAADGKALNEMIVFFNSFESVKNGTHTVENCFELVFNNWDHLSPFLQSQINLRQINSYINNILDGIRNNKKQQSIARINKLITDKFGES